MENKVKRLLNRKSYFKTSLGVKAYMLNLERNLKYYVKAIYLRSNTLKKLPTIVYSCLI